MRTKSELFFLLALTTAATGQGPRVEPQIAAIATVDSGVSVVHLAPRFTTVIRMPEPVNSVVVGDPASFQAEHAEREPLLVFVKPTTSRPAQTNLLISTSRGHQASLLLISRGEPEGDQPPTIDFLVRYQPAGRFLIEPSDYPSALVAQTVDLQDPATDVPSEIVMDRDRMPQPTGEPDDLSRPDSGELLEDLLERQRRAKLPILHGEKPGLPGSGKERLRAGVGEVIDQGREVVVLFSVVNPQSHSVELMPPQIQLGGKTKSGKIFRRSRWTTAEQLPIAAFLLSRRRLGPGERADGVVVFDRPSFKQSNETLFLQMAESGAVDRPALAPIGFGISTFEEEENHAR